MEEQTQFDYYDPCSHKVIEILDSELKHVSIQRCTLCGWERWHYDDAHG